MNTKFNHNKTKPWINIFRQNTDQLYIHIGLLELTRLFRSSVGDFDLSNEHGVLEKAVT